jgi:hypothetical protein
MDTDFLISMYSIVLPIVFGMMAGFFLIIGLRGILTKRPFLVSNKWLLWITFIVFIPNILLILFLPSSISILIKWLNPAIFTVGLVMLCFALKGYTAYGVTGTSFREAMLAALEKLQLPYERTLSTIRLSSVEVDLQVSVQSWMGAGQIKTKQRQHHSQLAEIVAAMNEHFQISSSPVNLVSCVFFVVMGVIMVISGVGMVFLFQNIIAKI